MSKHSPPRVINAVRETHVDMMMCLPAIVDLDSSIDYHFDGGILA